MATLLFAPLGWAKAPQRKRQLSPPATSSQSLHLRSIELEARRVVVDVAGFDKAPLPNLFTFTDERNRHFVATAIHCQAATGVQTCQLEIPAGYERFRLVSLVLHLNGLHGKTIAVDTAEVAAAWATASTPPSDAGTRP